MDKLIFKNCTFSSQASEAQVPLWFWNDKLQNRELIRQLELMSGKNVVCNAPHARTGFIGAYLDDEWMKNIGTVIDYKKTHGETMWLYDEFNWPAGMAAGEVTRHEAFREKYLIFTVHHVPAGQPFRLFPVSIRPSHASLEDMSKDLSDKVHIDNIFCFDAETMEKLDVTQFQPDPEEDIPFLLSGNDFEILRDRDTIVYEAKVLTEAYKGEGVLDPDYLNPDATDHFIDITFEAYYKRFPEAFGTVITADFNDETRFCHALPWTDRLLAEFRKRFGFDLEDHLADLILPGEAAGRIRCCYFDLLAELYRENYHARLNKWCNAHGIDYCPHMLGEETIAGQTRFGADLMRQVRETGRPGVDHLGKGIGSLNIRFISSAAEIYGKNGLACEVFAASGWSLTFSEYIRMITWLYSQGVKTIVNHGFFYSIEDFRYKDWPPSQFFQWSGWDQMDIGNSFCRRMYQMTEDCVRQTDLLIYHPIESFWMSYIPDLNFTHGYHLGPFISSLRARQIDREEQVLLNRLQEENRDFSVFPSDAADLFTIRDSLLVNTVTGQSYRVFVLPLCDVLPLKMAKLLDEFTTYGGQLVIMDSLPRYGMLPSEDGLVNEIMLRMLSRKNVRFLDTAAAEPLIDVLSEICPQSLKITEGVAVCRKNQPHYPDYLMDPYIHTGENMTGIYWCRYTGSETKYLFANYGADDEEITVEVEAATGKVPELWDPMTGDVTEITDSEAIITGNKQGFRLTIRVSASAGIFLVV